MEDELDAELEASFLKNSARTVLIESPQALCTGPSSSSSAMASSASRLTFAFPDWAIDIWEDAKRRKVSILRHSPQLAGSAGQVNVEAKKTEATSVIRSLKKKAWKLEADSRVWKLEDFEGGCAEFPIAGGSMHFEDDNEVKAEMGLEIESRTSFDELPDELLTNISKRLSIGDLCSAIQTCRRWNYIGLQDELWKACEDNIPQFINSSGRGCPRWTSVKNMILSDRVGQKFHGYRKAFEFLRDAMNSWWDSGKSDRYPAALFRTVVQKLTVNNWSLLYEGFGVIFIDRTDWIASSLLTESGFKEKFGSSCSSRQHSGSSKEEKGEYALNGHDGMLIWQALQTYWRRYKRWLMLVVSHCRELNHEVMAERARSHSLVSTPTVYDGGVIFFRSQIILRYRLRHTLQAGYTWLNTLDKIGSASDQETELLKSVHHLLQELDVHDDFTLSPTGYTREKLRRCFCNQETMTRKLQKQELSVLVTPPH